MQARSAAPISHHARPRRPLLKTREFAATAAILFILASSLRILRASRHTDPENEIRDVTAGHGPKHSSSGTRQWSASTSTLAKRTFVSQIDEVDHFLATPSLLSLPSGRLLVLFERQVSWGLKDATSNMKLLYASDDSGKSWSQIAAPGPLQWPQLFSCASGVYILGCQRSFSSDNNLLISRMEKGSEGAAWSSPTLLSRGLSVVTINSGVDVSAGRVTKAFETIPSMSLPRKASKLTAPLVVPIANLEDPRPSWHSSPTVTVSVQDANGFVVHTLVRIPHDGKALFFRVVAVDLAERTLQLRLERYTLFWELKDVSLPKGSVLEVGSGSNVYGGVDWVSMTMSANETADLTSPEAWSWSNPVGNPASLYPNEIRILFGAAFRADRVVRNSIIGFEDANLQKMAPNVAYHAGFGSLYWMEGVVFRLQDKRGGNGMLLNMLRVNNDQFCDLAALILVDDISIPGTVTAKFLRYKNVPGLAVGHPAVIYDAVTDLYWMVNNINRDSGRRWQQPLNTNEGDPKLHITPFSLCEVDRSTVGLFYSGNGVDWQPAGIVDYHMSFGRHFAYPHMTIVGNDLLIVMRATAWSGKLESTSQYYNNHNSNAISFHRILDFRSSANVEWATFGGPYTQTGPRSLPLEKT